MTNDLYLFAGLFLTLALIYAAVTIRREWLRLHYRDREVERGRLLLAFTPGVIGAALFTPGVLTAAQAPLTAPLQVPVAWPLIATLLIAAQVVLAFWIDTATWDGVWKPRAR